MDDLKVSQAWRFLHIEGWKGHFIAVELAPQLLIDAEERGHTNLVTDAARECAYIDLPGMVMADRKFFQVHVAGQPLDIPAGDFSYFYEEVRAAPPREFANGSSYRKIHGWLSCVVIPEGAYVDLLLEMEGMLDAARAQAKIEDQRFSEAISRLNKVSPVQVISRRDKTMMQKLAPPLSGTPNNEKN